MDNAIVALIAQRRRQCLVHSTLYYRMCTSIISDATFDRWAYELRDLQRDYPEESAAAPLAAEFIGWDGTTGFDLDARASYEVSEWALRKAAELLRLHEVYTKI